MSEKRQRRKAAWSELTKKKNKRKGDRRRGYHAANELIS